MYNKPYSRYEFPSAEVQVTSWYTHTSIQGLEPFARDPVHDDSAMPRLSHLHQPVRVLRRRQAVEVQPVLPRQRLT
ncbi:unnamed protein product [Leptidea sinapis]|uniref:Uncharacterized protein n=1 Tax=Leptidea sinapis TaxID=189913 RepID=A0A5E4R2Y3_9NEOP|nr:unnamed protein product [Leptidea sinapis]